jgi:UDP-glucuronate 4-epimerase
LHILVTGAAGFIGSHLCEALLAEGHEVRGLDSFTDYYPRAVKLRNLDAVAEHPNYRFHEADLRDTDLDALLEGIEVVINLAAMAGLMRSWDDLDAYVGCNILGLGRLLDASRRAGAGRFVQISTSSVYGVEAVGDESLPTRPTSPYGVTKLAAEHLVQAHVATHGFPAVILRYFSIYGPRQRPDMAYHIFTEALLRGEPIVVYGDGRQTRSNTYVADCVAGTIQAVHAATIGEVYNIGGGEVIELRNAIDMIAEAVGTKAIIKHQPARPGDQRHTAAVTTKAERAFGYRPVTQPSAGLREQVAWHRSLRGSHSGAGTGDWVR